MQKNQHLHRLSGGTTKHRKCSSPQAPICMDTRFRSVPTVCEPGTFGYVLPRHVLQQPPEEHLSLTLLSPGWMSEVKGQMRARAAAATGTGN